MGVYITGSALISSLGNDKKQALERLKSFDTTSYKEYKNFFLQEQKYFTIENTKNIFDSFFENLENVVQNAIDEAGLGAQDLRNTGLYIASTSMNMPLVEEHYKKKQELYIIGNGSIGEHLVTKFGLNTKALLFSTACTSSANALFEAKQHMEQNLIENAIVVGFEFANKTTYKGFEALMLVSQSGEFALLDEKSDGMILGEACSCVVLENEKKKKNDFQIFGSVSSFDAYSETSSNPDGVVIKETIAEVLQSSNMSIGDIDFINVHSPGTSASNLAEYNGVQEILQNENITLTSMKPYIGHTLGACSLNELVILESSLKNGFLPMTINESTTIQLPLSEKKEYQDNATILFTYNGFSGNNSSFIVSNKDI